jgi:hypothetical protein
MSIVFVSAIAIACSKKEAKDEPQSVPTPTAQPKVAESTTTEPPPPPPPPASDVPAQPAAPSPVVTPGPKHVTRPPAERADGDEEKVATEDATKKPAKRTAPPPKPKPASTATAGIDEKPKDTDRESQPAATALKPHVSVTTASHYACTTKDHKDTVSVASELRGARITIGGQGPCPGEIKEWTAEVAEKRVDVHGTHGAQAKCTCAGTGDMVLRGLEPGTYDVHVNGGFNRPIAVRVVVGSP